MTERDLRTKIHEHLEELASAQLFERHTHLDAIRSVGLDAVEVLIDTHEHHCARMALREVFTGLSSDELSEAAWQISRALSADKADALRTFALATLAESLSSGTAHLDRTVDIAVSPREELPLRIQALGTLRLSSRARDEHIRPVLNLLSTDPLRREPALMDAVFACLKRHAAVLSTREVMERLDPYLSAAEPNVRMHAIDLLGEVGDVDAIERICMLPNTESEVESIKDAVGRILLRPTNVLSLRPEHFEQFIAHLLRKMGHRDVEVTRFTHDEGVDVMSSCDRTNMKGVSEERWFIQCKRWATGNNVGESDLQRLLDLAHEKNAARALMITTSDFTKDALRLAQRHSSRIELVSGEELLRVLEKHFGPDRFTIKPR